MIIRPMEPREIDSIVNLFAYYAEAAGIEVYDDNRVLATIREYNIRPNLCFRVALIGSRPVGVIGGFLSEDPIETEVTATIQFLYLLEEYATVEAYEQLIGEFRAWADQFKATAIRAIDIGRNHQRLQAVYDQLGFDPIRITVMNKEIQ